MLNERTADVAVDAQPDELGTSHTVAGLRLTADLLEGIPGLPELYVTVPTDGAIGVQICSGPGEPGERCQAVARIAQEAGGVALVQPSGSDWWFFETHVKVGDRNVRVYTCVAGPESGRGGDAA